MQKILSPKIVYPIITIVFFILIGLLAFYIVRFFTSSIDGAFKIDQTAVEASLGKVDLEKYKAIAPRFGIDTSNIQ